MKSTKTKILSALICAFMMLSSASSVSAHTVQIAWCQLGNGDVRVHLEHWHDDLSSSDLPGNGINITTAYGSTTITQDIDPTGFINNTVIGSLPAGGGLTVLGGCSGDANTYNDWLYYDFPPAVCGQSVTITFNYGLSATLDEACGTLFPRSVTTTFTDVSAPTFTNCGDVTVQSCSPTTVTFAKTAVDDCDPSPSVTYSIASGSTFKVGTTQVTATAKDNLNKTSTCVFNVIVSPPSISATATNNSPCAGTTLNLNVTTVGSSTYSWAGPNSFTSTSQNPSISNAQAVNAGTYTVTIKDGGCTNTRSTVVTVLAAITPSSSSPYNGGVNTNLYIGYGSQSATLTVAGFGGTISWSPTTNLSNSGILNPVFTPSGAGNYTYTVTGSTSNCNSYSAKITMCVSDIHVPGTTGNKYAVYMCHKEPVTNKVWTQAVVLRGVSSHFANHPGDYLGSCGSDPCTTKKRDFEVADLVIDEQFLEVMCTPNPFHQSFKLNYVSHLDLEATISIYGMTGKLLETKTLNGIANEAELGNNLPNGIYSVSFNQGDIKKVFRMIKLD
jgi:hypothetical protein